MKHEGGRLFGEEETVEVTQGGQGAVAGGIMRKGPQYTHMKMSQ